MKWLLAHPFFVRAWLLWGVEIGELTGVQAEARMAHREDDCGCEAGWEDGLNSIGRDMYLGIAESRARRSVRRWVL